jgi:hypothetical protein
MTNCDKNNCKLFEEESKSRWTKEDIDKTLKEYMSHIDYEVGDWVETCQFLPGIVQKINVRFNSDPDYDCFEDNILIFYPHYAFEHKEGHNGKYCGGSCCSVNHCGVHKITPQYACKLMALGKERLEKLWNEVIKGQSNGVNADKKWSEYVEELYAKEFPRGFDLQ